MQSGTASINYFRVWLLTHQRISLILDIFTSLYLFLIPYIIYSMYFNLFYLMFWHYDNWLPASYISPLVSCFFLLRYFNLLYRAYNIAKLNFNRTIVKVVNFDTPTINTIGVENNYTVSC